MTKDRQITEVAPEHGGGATLHSTAPPENVRLSDTDRLETFSDGIFAITITLLVFDIVRPDYEPGHLWEQLLAQWPNYVAFLASFVTSASSGLIIAPCFHACDSATAACIWKPVSSVDLRADPISNRAAIRSASARQRFGRYYCRRDLRRRRRPHVSLAGLCCSTFSRFIRTCRNIMSSRHTFPASAIAR